jgi:hypothetical protein
MMVTGTAFLMHFGVYSPAAKKDYDKGNEAKKKFENTMRALSRVPKSAVAEKIKAKKKKGKD